MYGAGVGFGASSSCIEIEAGADCGAKAPYLRAFFAELKLRAPTEEQRQRLFKALLKSCVSTAGQKQTSARLRRIF